MEWKITDDNFKDLEYIQRLVSEELKKDHQVVDFRVNQNRKIIFKNILVDELKRQSRHNYRIIFIIIEGTRYTIHKSIDWNRYNSNPCPNLINNMYYD